LAIQWMDDFTCYGTDGGAAARMLDGVYAQATGALSADPDVNSAGLPVLNLAVDSSRIRKVLTAPQTTVGVAARYWLSSLPASGVPVIAEFADASLHTHMNVQVNASGILEVHRFDTGTDVLMGSSSSPVITSNAWRHVEIKVFFDVAVGTVEIRVEGVTVLSLTGVRTTSNIAGYTASIQNITMHQASSAGLVTWYVKDLIMWDGSGGVNNNFMGSCQVLKLLPTGDISLGWTPSSGTTGYNLINDTTPDDDTNYISAAFPAPSPSTFSLSDLPVNVSTVRGVQLMHRSKKTDGGDGNIQVTAVSGANNGLGVDRPITTAYTYMWDIYNLDPSGSAWSRTLVNALQMKLNRTL
jgi:hypothetical protein